MIINPYSHGTLWGGALEARAKGMESDKGKHRKTDRNNCKNKYINLYE